MESIKITFRLSSHELARDLQTIRRLDPSYKLTSINALAKTIYNYHHIKIATNKPESVPIELLTEILTFTNKPANDKITIADLMNMERLK